MVNDIIGHLPIDNEQGSFCVLENLAFDRARRGAYLGSMILTKGRDACTKEKRKTYPKEY